MTATPAQINQLRQVNTQGNAIPYNATPGTGEPPEWWSNEYNPAWSWVCRDYVEYKAQQLRSAGWPVAGLLTVLTWTEVINDPNDQWGGREMHAVLRVAANDDIYILDSRAPDIYKPEMPPFDYRWEKEQVAGTDGYRDISQSGVA